MISFIARQLRRLAAFIALVALLVGAPWALYRLGMPFLPDHVPSGAEIWNTLTQRDTGQVFLGTLVVIGFIAWAIFAASLLTDIAARIARRPAIRLPGLHAPQAAASVLVGLIIAGTITTSAAPAAVAATSGMPALPRPAAAAATASMTQNAVTSHATSARIATARPGTTPPMSTWTPIHNGTGESATRATPSKSSGPVWIVQPGDTLWAIAEQSLGDPLRYPELVEINEGRAQPDGKTLNSADFLLPGWHIHLPADATLPAEQQADSGSVDVPDAVEVEPGDTLSQIALDTLGDANDYHQLAKINGIDNPDLIYPGEIIQIPDPAANSASANSDAGTGPRQPEDSADEPEVDDSAPPADDGHTHTGSSSPDMDADMPVATPHEPSESNEINPANGGLAAPNNAVPGRHSEKINPSNAPADSQGSTGGATATASSSHEAETRWMLGGATGLLAAIAWAGLLVTRRRLEQSRKPGQLPVRSTLAEARMDRALREKAHAADPETVNRAMRAITNTVAEHTPDGFDVILIGADAIELRPANPAEPPDPFHGTDTAWTARLDDLDAATDEDGEERLAAIPALVTLGTTSDGRAVVIDLEHYGAIALTGNEERCRELRNHMIVELAQSPWTDGIHLALDDVPDGISKLDSDRIEIVDDLERAAKRLTAHTKRIRDILGDAPIARARTSQLLADAWEPHILIANSADLTSDECESLIETVEAGPPAAAALIAVGDNVGFEQRVSLDCDGTVAIPAVLDDLAVHAAGMSDDELATLGGMFNPSLSRSHPSTLANDTAPADTVAPPNEIATTGDEGSSPLHIVMPESNTVAACRDDISDSTPHVDIDGADGGPDAPESPERARVGSVTISPQKHPGDPESESLDDDVAEWYADSPTRPHVAILGPAEVAGVGPRPDRIERRMTEYAVYLALYPNGVSVDKFVTDLWPDSKPPTSSARRADMSRLRNWLGTPEDSDRPFIPQSVDGHYRLDGRLVDAELFSGLCSRAGEQASLGEAHAALTDYQAALNMVRGPVLPEAGGPSYAWLSNSDRMEDRFLPMQIVDAAHAAADIALTIGDTCAAQKAATIGRLVDADSSIPLCDLVRTAIATHDHETARSWADVLLTVNDLDTPDDLPDHIRDVVIDLYLRHGRRSQPKAS